VADFLTILSYLLVPGYLALIAWALHSHQNHSIAWLGVWNGVILVVSLLVLPWITSGGETMFDARARELSLHPQISSLLEKVTIETLWNETPILYAVITCAGDEMEKCLAKVPEGKIREFADLVRKETNIQAFRLVSQSAGTSSGLRVTIVVLLIWSVTNLLWIFARLAGALLPGYLNVGLRWVLIGVGILLMPLILWYLPIVDTLGYRETFGISAVTLLAAAQVGSGIGWTSVGLLTGLAVIILSTDSAPVSDEEFS